MILTSRSVFLPRLIGGALLLAVTSLTQAAKLPLDSAEKAYLEAKGGLKMCVDPNWMPYERISESGQHEGIAADYMQLFVESIGVELELYVTQSWQQTLDAVRQRRCDFISMARNTAERRAYLDFTQPYISLPMVIATGMDKFYIEDIGFELDKRFAVVKGYAVASYLREKYPSIKLLEVKNIETGLRLLRTGEVFGYVDSVLPIGHTIQQNAMLDIKISGEVDYRSAPSVATRNDEPLLVGIMQKAIDALTVQQRQEILNRWIAVKVERPKNYRWILATALAALCLTLLVLYWNRKLALANRRAKEALSRLAQMQKALEKSNSELQTQAQTDKLTGLFNRNKLDAVISERQLQGDRQLMSFGVILFDIDFFKQVNDRHGHAVGDQVLVDIASLIAGQCRGLDVAGRWGGEEFLIVGAQVELEGLLALAERLRRAIEHYEFLAVGSLSASFGVACYRPQEGAAQLLERADKALYRAKEAGRNRVEGS